MPVSDRLRRLRERVEARQDKQELQRQLAKTRAEQQPTEGRLPEPVQQALKPIRIESRASAQEARKLADTVGGSTIPGGGAAKRAASGAGRLASKAASATAEVSRTAAEGAQQVETRPREDDTDAMLRRAEQSASAAAPVDATLDPVTGPEELSDFVTGSNPGGTQPIASRSPPPVDFLVTGPPADRGGMMELVLGGGGGVDDDPMESFVTGSGFETQADEGFPAVDALVPGQRGDR
jgi:hypothetical protein